MRKWIVGAAVGALFTAAGAGVAMAETTRPGGSSGIPAAVAAHQTPKDDHVGAGHGRGRARRALRRAGALAAKTIGIPASELRQDVQNGQSIAEVATAHQVAPQTVVDALVKAADTRIDDAVKNQRLTQARADALKQRVPKVAQRLVDHKKGG